MSETVQHQMCCWEAHWARWKTFQFSATHNLHRGETHASLNSLKSNMWFWQQVIFQRKPATSCRAFSAFSIFCFCAPRSIHGNSIEPVAKKGMRRKREKMEMEMMTSWISRVLTKHHKSSTFLSFFAQRERKISISRFSFWAKNVIVFLFCVFLSSRCVWHVCQHIFHLSGAEITHQRWCKARRGMWCQHLRT